MNQKTERIDTALGSVVGNLDVDFSRDDGWDRISEHINVHKYLLDTANATDLEWDRAATSWKQSVFEPLLSAVSDERIRKEFPDKTLGDLYLEVSDHWHFLKLEGAFVTAATAAVDYADKFGVSSADGPSRPRRARWLRRWADARDIDRRVTELRDNTDLLNGIRPF